MKKTTNTDLKELLWQSIKDLPNENIKEILNFIAFTKSKVFKYEQSSTQNLDSNADEDLLLKLIELSEKDFNNNRITINEEFEKESMLW